MKTMTCKQLGGACGKEFHADTFDEIAKKSQRHGMEMAEKNDEAHLKAMEKIKQKSQEEMKEWMQIKKKEFEELPEDK